MDSTRNPRFTDCHYTQRAAEKRREASRKGGGRSSRIAGHLALAYGALARAKAARAETRDDVLENSGA